MSIRKLVLVGIASISTLAAASARSAIITADWSGTISTGEYTDGTDISGKSFDLIFSFDTSQGVVQNGPYGVLWGGGPLATDFPGFTECCASSPASIVFKSDGLTKILLSNGYTMFNAIKDAVGVSWVMTGAGGPGETVERYMQVSGSPTLPTVFGAAYDGDPCAGATQCIGTVYGLPVEADLNIDHLKVTNSDGGAGGIQIPTAFVPEPSTWVVMFSGLGLVGAALRRRRIASATAN